MFGEERYTEGMKNALRFAKNLASIKCSDYVTTEIFLYGAIDAGGDLLRVFEEATGKPDLCLTIRKDLYRKLPKDGQFAVKDENIKCTNRVERVLKLCCEEADIMGNSDVSEVYIPLGVIREGNSQAAQILSKYDLRIEGMRNAADKVIRREY
jgi:ATP-dependent Clp protease ATP-binding subunit ClpA